MAGPNPKLWVVPRHDTYTKVAQNFDLQLPFTAQEEAIDAWTVSKLHVWRFFNWDAFDQKDRQADK